MIEGGSSFVRSRQSNNGTCAEKEPRTLLDWTMMMSPWPAFSIGAAAVCCFCSLLSTIYKNTNKVMNRSELIKYGNVLLAAEAPPEHVSLVHLTGTRRRIREDEEGWLFHVQPCMLCL